MKCHHHHKHHWDDLCCSCVHVHTSGCRVTYRGTVDREIDDKGYVVVTFGRYNHTLRFSHNAFKVIERKMRDGRDSRMALFVTRGFLLQPAIGARQ